MRRNPLLVIATMLAVLVSSFLVFTTLSARAIVENNTSRWQNGVHVVIFLDDRVTSTAHKQLQETLETYPEVRMVEYFSKSGYVNINHAINLTLIKGTRVSTDKKGRSTILNFDNYKNVFLKFFS